MLESLSVSVVLLFLIIVLSMLGFFFFILKKSEEQTRIHANFVTIGIILWIVLQSVLSVNDVYNSNVEIIPPVIFLIGILPTIILILVMFNTKFGKVFIDGLSQKYLTLLHAIRIPVEITLWLLFMENAIPEIMTFEGWNYDIIAGITALFVFYFGFVKKSLSNRILLIWNILCLCLLVNIVIIAFLSAPFPLQQFGFDQPNVALIYFPMSLLPTFVVPLVIFSHLVSIRQILNPKN